MSLLDCDNITLAYEGRPLLEHLSFSVQPGDYLCILGENGSGKSTLMRALLGLHPLRAGQIRTGDGLRPGEIGYLPQQTAVQRDFPATVEEIVLSGCIGRCRSFFGRAEKRRAAENMERMGITNLARRCYRELSGGQQQRVLLARALCATEKLLLLDEPVSGLDPGVTAEMYRLIARLNAQGVAILMITHDLAAVEYASHVLHIGTPLFFGTKSQWRESRIGRSFCAARGGDAPC